MKQNGDTAKTLDMVMRLYGEDVDHLEIAQALGCLAMLFHMRGEHDNAIAKMRVCAKMCQ